MQAVKLLTATLTSSVALVLGAVTSNVSPIRPIDSKLIRTSSALPLVFEKNAGQAPAGVDFVGRTPEGTVLLRQTGAELIPRGGKRRVTMKLPGAKLGQPEPADPLASVSNYFLGRDPAKWRTNVPHYGQIRYRDVYPGVDLVYYGSGGRLEYDVVLSPTAAGRAIEVAFEGADRIRTDSNGDLLIEASNTTMRQLRPHVYQNVGGRRVQVEASYRIKSNGHVEFALGRYHAAEPLVIDPVVQYAAYAGGLGKESIAGIAVDGSGNAYVVGDTNSENLAQGNVPQNFKRGDSDAFIGKIGPSGNLIWLSFLGGSGPDFGLSIAVDSSGNPYVCGVTFSTNFPSQNGIQPEFQGGEFDSFVAKLSSSGSQLMWSTYLGGSAQDWATSIAVEGAGGAWVTGWTTSPNFPHRNGVEYAGGGGDVFVTRVSPSGGDVTYSAFVGGNGRDLASGIAVGGNGHVFVTGGTSSTALPRPAQGRAGSDLDAFVFELDPATSELVFFSVLGGPAEDFGIKIAADAVGNAYVAGYTKSAGFPVTRASAQTAIGGMTDAFVAKVNKTQVEYATFVGGSGDDWVGGIAIDAAGSAYVSGWTNSSNYPTRNAFQTQYFSGNVPIQRYDATVFRLSPAGDTLLYSSYFGGTGEDRAYGIALDQSGNVYIGGDTTSTNLPSATNGFGSATAGLYDGFVARISADAAINLLSASPQAVNLSARTSDTQIAPLTVALSATAGSLAFSAGTNVPWLTVRPESGSTRADLQVTIDPSILLSAGVKTGEITVRSGANTLRIPVTLTVTAAPAISAINPTSLVRGSGQQTIVLSGGGFVSASYVEINGTRLQTTYSGPGELRAIVPEQLLASETSLNVFVVNPDGRSRSFVLPVVAAGPAINALVNAATNAPGAVAPGEIVVLTGSGFGPDTLVQASAVNGRFDTTLASTRVLFDGVAAPLLWAVSGKIALVVPYSVGSQTTTHVAVETRGQQSAATTLQVQAANPGLFTANTSGLGQAAAFNENGTANSASNPASRGSVLVLYGTGEGLPRSGTPDGSVVSADNLTRPSLSITVLIGGIPATVDYSGGSPGSIAGLLQLNVHIPDSAPAGDAVPVVVFAGGFSSPSSGVTVVIR